MKLNTMAAVMSFVSKLENDSSSFYQNWAGKYQELEDVLLAWPRENKKFEKQVKQTYFGVITDAIESTFSFAQLETDDYEIDMKLPEDTNLQNVKKKAGEIEETIKNFYAQAARLSECLMADIPRLFRKIAKEREKRLLLLDI